MAFVPVVLSTMLWASGNGKRMSIHEAPDAEGICCCKPHKCRNGSDGTVYHFDQHMCCKPLTGQKCERIPYGYTEQKGLDFCVPNPPAELPVWTLPGDRPKADPETLDPESDAHTLHAHCARGGDSRGLHEEDDVIGSLTDQLAKNSLQSMTHDIFTMYACVRWVPEDSYLPLIADEMDANQVPSASKTAGDDLRLLMARAAEHGNFIPLRCSENVGVYDQKVNGSVYAVFEERVQAMSSFFSKESGAFFDARATNVETRKMFDVEALPRWSNMLEHSSLFDSKLIQQKLKACSPKDSMVVGNSSHFAGRNGKKADPQMLLDSCPFIKWWAPKLKMYLARFPFQGYMANTKGSSLPAGGRVLICFGKRISGGLHRRKGGSHILTDMNGVGCHGFWDFQKASEMLRHMVNLWAPPTCQLTELELKMKTRLLEMFTQMNKNLFEALPSIIASEQFDPSTRGAEEATGARKLTAGFSWIANLFSSMGKAYESMADMMGSSVMKWAVCPVGNEEGLDGKLGSDEMLTQRFAKKAYSFITNTNNGLPGTTCQPFQFTKAVDGLESCDVGTVRSDYPEPYKGVKFACPAAPLLPGKEQLKVLADTHKNKCFVWATPEQLGVAKWPYNGLLPLELQYPARGHTPTEQMELIQVLDFRSALDVYGFSRDFVSLGRVCTVEIRGRYERWCSKPQFLPSASLADLASEAGADLMDSATSAFKASRKNYTDTQVWKSWAHRAALRTGSLAKRTASAAAASAADAFSGLARARYERIKRERVYQSMEAGEALWGAVFQASSKDAAAAGKRLQFDRFAVSVPCEGVDVPSMIESEFQWGQGALEVLKQSLTSQPLGAGDSAVTLSVRSEYELRRGTQVKLKSFLSWSRMQDQWHQVGSPLPYLNALMGVTTGSSYSKSLGSLYGLSLRFVCGRRDEVYYVDSFTPRDTFRACVMEGKKQAEATAKKQSAQQDKAKALQTKLDRMVRDIEAMRSAIDEADEGERQKLEAKVAKQETAAHEQEEALDAVLRQHPLTLQEYDAEVVVRVTFEPLQECHSYDQGLVQVIQDGADAEAPEAARHAAAAAKALQTKSRSCMQAASLAQAPNKDPATVIGAWMGSGAPAETRKEVVITAIDVASWLV